MQRVRPALDVLAKEIGLKHALASKALYTDGAELLFDYARQGHSDQVAWIRSSAACSATGLVISL